MAIINTGAVERTIIGKHDANFVHPLGDELISNGSFDTDSDWVKGTGWSIQGNSAVYSDGAKFSQFRQQLVNNNTSNYQLSLDVTINSGQFRVKFGSNNYDIISQSGSYKINGLFNANNTFITFEDYDDISSDFSIDNVSVKEVLVNRESNVTNTGAVERDIEASHDANFVHPLGDELVSNGTFDVDSDWIKQTGWSISGGKANHDGLSAYKKISQLITTEIGKTYQYKVHISNLSTGQFYIMARQNSEFGAFYFNNIETENGDYTFTFTAVTTLTSIVLQNGDNNTLSIDNVSVKEVLVNRESDITNTGVTIRDIEGINVSDEMFPDNTISNIVNIAGLISSLLNSLESRSTYYENEENTINLLKNLNC